MREHPLFEQLWNGSAQMEEWTAAVSQGAVTSVADNIITVHTTCFDSALDIAQRQGALTWELRAALSLARLRVAQNRQGEARAILAPVFDRVTEGFGTADLRAARDMLGELQP
jgi:hypothetical protein